MSQNSGSKVFSKRNILGAVLVAGIVAGVYLGDIWKGFGGGSITGVGVTDPGTSKGPSKESGESGTSKPAAVATDSEPDTNKTAASILEVVKIVIADGSYYLRSNDGDEPADLKRVVAVAKTATGDEDGIRVRVYRKLSSRAATEVALQDALVAAGITEEQTSWVANPIEE